MVDMTLDIFGSSDDVLHANINEGSDDIFGMRLDEGSPFDSTDDVLDVTVSESSSFDDADDDILGTRMEEDVSIPVPNKTEIDVSTYNEFLMKMKQSFKEQAELVEMVRATIG